MKRIIFIGDTYATCEQVANKMGMGASGWSTITRADAPERALEKLIGLHEYILILCTRWAIVANSASIVTEARRDGSLVLDATRWN